MGKACHVSRNDVVTVISGNHAGKRGRVLSVQAKRNKVIVEGINYVWKHVKPNRKNPRGGRIQIEAPIDISNVMMLCQNRECPRHDQGVRVKQISLADGTRARGCAKCGHEIPRRVE